MTADTTDDAPTPPDDEKGTASVSTPGGAIPTQLGIGEEVHTTVDGEEVVAIGTAPSGLAVILTPAGWRLIRSWKFDHLKIIAGRVHAAAKGCHTRPLASSLLTGTTDTSSRQVKYRNGNGLDLREDNLVVVPSHLVYAARHKAQRPPPGTPRDYDVLPNGSIRASKPSGSTAAVRLEKLVHGDD